MDTLETVAIAAHGILVAGHSLGAIYHWREEKPVYIAVHIAGMLFSIASIINHVRSLEEK